jgi:hypothetical protein
MRDQSKYLEPQGHHCKIPLKTKASFLLFKPSRFAFSVFTTRTSSLLLSLCARVSIEFQNEFNGNFFSQDLNFNLAKPLVVDSEAFVFLYDSLKILRKAEAI